MYIRLLSVSMSHIKLPNVYFSGKEYTFYHSLQFDFFIFGVLA